MSAASFGCPHCNGIVVVSAGAVFADNEVGKGLGVAVFTNEDTINPSRPQSLRRPAAAKRARQEPATNQCPVHHTAVPSRFGGLYCNRPDASSGNGWCTWSSGAA